MLVTNAWPNRASAITAETDDPPSPTHLLEDDDLTRRIHLVPAVNGLLHNVPCRQPHLADILHCFKELGPCRFSGSNAVLLGLACSLLYEVMDPLSMLLLR